MHATIKITNECTFVSIADSYDFKFYLTFHYYTLGTLILVITTTACIMVLFLLKFLYLNECYSAQFFFHREKQQPKREKRERDSERKHNHSNLVET